MIERVLLVHEEIDAQLGVLVRVDTVRAWRQGLQRELQTIGRRGSRASLAATRQRRLVIEVELNCGSRNFFKKFQVFYETTFWMYLLNLWSRLSDVTAASSGGTGCAAAWRLSWIRCSFWAPRTAALWSCPMCPGGCSSNRMQSRQGPSGYFLVVFC